MSVYDVGSQSQKRDRGPDAAKKGQTYEYVGLWIRGRPVLFDQLAHLAVDVELVVTLASEQIDILFHVHVDQPAFFYNFAENTKKKDVN